MRRSTISVFMTAGLLAVLLSGCRMGGGPGGETTGPETQENASNPVTITAQESVPESKVNPEMQEDMEGNQEPGVKQVPAPGKQVYDLPYQFASKYGIFQSEYPVYELDAVVESRLPQKEKTISLTSALHQKQELLVSMVLDDYGEVQKIPAGGEPPADSRYFTLSDGTMIVSEKYQDELWKSGEGLFLTGPGIPEGGIKPVESVYADYSAYFEEYGNIRYIIEARFELPSAPVSEELLSGYAIRLFDFEKPVEFDLKSVPEYGTLEELAKEENGSIDTHNGISIISMGEKVKEGILISWYVYSEEGKPSITIGYKTPSLDTDTPPLDMPTISGSGRQYEIKALSANPYWDNLGNYRLSDIKQYGRRLRCLFEVPQEEQDGPFQMHIPGITFLNSEESAPVTLPVPEDYEELNETIPWRDGSVRILGITRMKEPQTAKNQEGQGNAIAAERPAVYIDVAAVHEDRELALKALLCQSKAGGSRWERQPYEFDEKGNLSGFRIFYKEGDTEVTLKFHGAAFYWNQPYEMQIDKIK